jgi:hypothetical protein
VPEEDLLSIFESVHAMGGFDREKAREILHIPEVRS